MHPPIVEETVPKRMLPAKTKVLISGSSENTAGYLLWVRSMWATAKGGTTGYQGIHRLHAGDASSSVSAKLLPHSLPWFQIEFYVTNMDLECK